MSQLSIAVCSIPIVLGLTLALGALFHDPGRGRRRCPKCFYDMTGIGLRCPECGHPARGEGELHYRRRRWRLATIGCVLLLAGPAIVFIRPRYERLVRLLLPRWEVEDERVVEGYTFRILFNRRYGYAETVEHDQRRLEILDEHGTVFSREDWWFSIETVADVTGDGHPEVVIDESSGGNGCNDPCLIFECADPVSLLLQVTCATLEDIDHDGIREVLALDRTYAYRWTCGACSPYPAVILRFHNGGYHLAPDLMWRARPNLDELEAQVMASPPNGQDSTGVDSTVHQELLRVMLDLIYSGQEDSAWALLARPAIESPIIPDKLQFERELRQALSESPYAEDIRLLNAAARGRREIDASASILTSLVAEGECGGP